jgi:hypothetical protein
VGRRAIDRWPTGFTLAVALMIGALGALGVGGLALDGVGAVLMGICFIGTPTMFTALPRRAVPTARYTVSLSVLTTVFALGQMAGPSIGGVVADTHGLAWGAATASGILAHRRAPRRCVRRGTTTPGLTCVRMRAAWWATLALAVRP